MDANNQPTHEKRLSKLSGSSTQLKQREKDKDNCVATLGPNHPALAMPCMHGPTRKIALSAPPGVHTSTRRTLDAHTVNPMALSTQEAHVDKRTLPNPRVLLNLDEAMYNESKDEALSDDSLPSDMLTKQGGWELPKRGQL